MCLAEREGFEPSKSYPLHTFQACSFDRSDTSPNKVDLAIPGATFFILPATARASMPGRNRLAKLALCVTEVTGDCLRPLGHLFVEMVATQSSHTWHTSPLLPLLPSRPGGVHNLSLRGDRKGSPLRARMLAKLAREV